MSHQEGIPIDLRQVVHQNEAISSFERGIIAELQQKIQLFNSRAANILENIKTKQKQSQTLIQDAIAQQKMKWIERIDEIFSNIQADICSDIKIHFQSPKTLIKNIQCCWAESLSKILNELSSGNTCGDLQNQNQTEDLLDSNLNPVNNGRISRNEIDHQMGIQIESKDKKQILVDFINGKFEQSYLQNLERVSNIEEEYCKKQQDYASSSRMIPFNSGPLEKMFDLMEQFYLFKQQPEHKFHENHSSDRDQLMTKIRNDRFTLNQENPQHIDGMMTIRTKMVENRSRVERSRNSQNNNQQKFLLEIFDNMPELESEAIEESYNNGLSNCERQSRTLNNTVNVNATLHPRNHNEIQKKRRSFRDSTSLSSSKVRHEEITKNNSKGKNAFQAIDQFKSEMLQRKTIAKSSKKLIRVRQVSAEKTVKGIGNLLDLTKQKKSLLQQL